MAVFNNWSVVAEGWYIACASRALRKGRSRSLDVWGQKLFISRNPDGQVTIRDACSLSNPAMEPPVKSYATEEKYGFIWVYPVAIAPYPVPEFEDLQGKPIVFWHEVPALLRCHPHLYMINAVDIQHLRTIHKLPEMEPTIHLYKSGTTIDVTCCGLFKPDSITNRFKRLLIGRSYEYTIRYVDGCTGLLTNVKGAPGFPILHTLFAPLSVAPGKTQIQPVYVAEKQFGLLGWCRTWITLLISRYVYLHVLLIDREIRIFRNIRFSPNVLLPVDKPVLQYIRYVDRLKPSIWSQPHTQSQANDLPR